MTTTLLIDDERDFRDGREHTVVRSSQEAIELFQQENVAYDEVWLDYILAGNDTMFHFAVFANDQAKKGFPLNVGTFIIHTSSGGGYQLLKEILSESGYYSIKRFSIAGQSHPPVLV